EKAERSADEKRPIEHGIEGGRMLVGRVAVPAGVEDRQLVSHPIFVDRKLERGHLRVDVRALAGDSVQAVFAEDLIKRVIDVEPADVSVTGPAEVIRLQIMIDHGAEQVRSSKKTIFVVMPAVVVEVADKAELAGITFPNQVLAENIRD